MPAKAAQSKKIKFQPGNSENSAKKSSHKNAPAEKSSAKAIGYLRVSTGDQELDKNKADILHLANHLNLGQVSFVEEIVSGKVSWKKRKIAEVIAEFTKGDILIVSELSRLGRSMLECMEILSVAVEKGVRVYAVKGNWSLDSSIQSKIVAMAFSMASEIERDLISQRTKEALRYKKEQGIKLGRPPGAGKSKLDEFRPEIEALIANGTTQKFIAQRYKATEATVSNWIKKNKIKLELENSGE
jgi:DNA invertase Pin-like site-specific DNA recombinase